MRLLHTTNTRLNPTGGGWKATGLFVCGLLLALALSFGVVVADDFLDEIKDKPPQERLELLRSKVDEGEANKEIYFHLGNAYYESGDAASAANAFQKAIELDRTFFKAMVNLALMYDEQQNYAKAIEVFERAAELDPRSPEVWSHMGNTYYAQQKYSKAMEFYNKALELDAKATHAIYSIGVAFADAGMFREAVKYWTQVSAIEPDSELGRSAAENVELLKKYLIPPR